LARAYGERLERYTRTLIYRKDGALIVIDRVKSREPHKFSVVWHPASGTEVRDGNPVRIRHSGSALDLQVFGSASLLASSEPAPLLLNQFERSEKAHISRPVILRYVAKEPSSEAFFVSILFPCNATDAPASFTWTPKAGGYEAKAGSMLVRIEGDSVRAVDGHTRVMLRGR
jgi:hypothetical protein